MKLIRLEDWMKLDHECFNRNKMVLYLTIDPTWGEIVSMLLYQTEYLML
jgi:hypothetical protein